MNIDDNHSGRGRRDIKGTVAEHNRNIAERKGEAFDEMDNLPEDFMARSSLGFMRTFDGAEHEMERNDIIESKLAFKKLYDDMMLRFMRALDIDEDYDEKQGTWTSHPSLLLRTPSQSDGSWVEVDMGYYCIDVTAFDQNGHKRDEHSYRSDSVNFDNAGDGKPVYRRDLPDSSKQYLEREIINNSKLMIDLDTPPATAALIGSPEFDARQAALIKELLANMALAQQMGINDQPVSTSEIEGLRRLLEQAEPYDNEDLSTDVL